MAPESTWVLATGNRGKLKELSARLSPLGIQVVPQSDLGVDSIPETGTTFEANAALKALHAARATGLTALADDSGLVVDALGGRPGVYSARFAGEGATDQQNMDRLLAELASTDDRGAHFCCVLALANVAWDQPHYFYGRWPGEILRQRMGEGGFGYDPIFQATDLTVSAAQLPPAQKNAISHRAQALDALFRALDQGLVRGL